MLVGSLCGEVCSVCVCVLGFGSKGGYIGGTRSEGSEPIDSAG